MSRKDLSGVVPLNDTITSDDLLGKEVFDNSGASAGIVDIVHLDPHKLEFVGISIDEGFMKKGLTVGKEYIERISSRAVFLNIRPAFVLRGMMVFDMFGRYIGRVKDVSLVDNKNTIKELVVSQRWFSTISLPGTVIKKVGENVFLSVSRDDLGKFSAVPIQSRRDQ